MRRPSTRRIAVCSAVSMALACLSMPPVFAQSTLPTTPEPSPANPGQPPDSVAPPVPQPGPIVAGAGTGIGMLRVLPESVKGDSIINDPEFNEKLPKQALLEAGMGLATAQANSEAFLAQERAIAESAPLGFAYKGSSQPLPGMLAQTARPDHEKPKSGGLRPPDSPLSSALDFGLLKGRVHARWDKQMGPCVKPIADATTTLGELSAVNALPALPGGGEKAPQLLSGSDAAGKSAAKDALGGMPGPLERLGGLLRGKTSTTDESGSLLNASALRAHSTIRLVDVPGQDGKAVRAISEFSLSDITLFAGTPQQLRIEVVSEPKLTATSTGNPETSKVNYQAPVLRVSRDGKELYTLDAAHPEFELPIGVPMPGSDTASNLPLVGQAQGGNVLDIGVLKLSLANLTKDKVGREVRGGVRLMDVKILPTEKLGIGSALAQVSFGEQFVRAKAPEGGVHCDRTAPPADGPQQADNGPDQQARPVPELAKTSGAYHAMSLFWTGAIMLLLGSVLVAALPRRR